MPNDDWRAREILDTILARLRVLTCSDAWASSLYTHDSNDPTPLMRALCKGKKTPTKAGILRELRRLKLYPPGGKDTRMVPDAAGTFTPPQINGEYVGADEEDLRDRHLIAAARSPSAVVIDKIQQSHLGPCAICDNERRTRGWFVCRKCLKEIKKSRPDDLPRYRLIALTA